jgi:hypothetical protein
VERPAPPLPVRLSAQNRCRFAVWKSELGVAALEDKLLQRAVVEVLNAIYETDYRGFSYGFRPWRSPHHALDALAVGIQRKKVNWCSMRTFLGFMTPSTMGGC